MFRKIIFPVSVFFIWRFFIFIFQIFIQPHYIITNNSITLTQRLFTSWTGYWDGAHYLSIATKGYHFPQQAFFPLWPLLIKVVTSIGLSAGLASYLLTLVLGFANFVLFYLLATKLMGNFRAKWALVIFTCYPATIFLHAGYSENLFLLLTLTSFLLLENKKYLLSALSGGLATASRMAGIAFVSVIPFIKISFRNKLYMIFLGVLGLAGYMIYLYINYGDFLYFIKGQLAWCAPAGRCGFTLPLSPLIDDGRNIFSGRVSINLLSFRFNDWLSSIVFLGLLPQVFKRLPKHYFIYSLVVLLMPLSSGSTTSMVRITLTVFPIFFVLPLLLKSKYVKVVLCLILLLLELRFVALFTGLIWVA